MNFFIKRIPLFIILFISCRTYAQNFCITPDTGPDQLQQIPQSRLAVPSSNYVLRIFVHIMRRSNGTGGQTQADVTQGLNTVVADFAPHGICVSLLGIDEIWNDAWYTQSNFTIDGNGDGKFDNFSPNSHNNAIDIYLFSSDANLQGGIASNIPGTALALGGTAFGSNLASSHVLSHELGHCVGLHHTFRGLCTSDVCRELVNGSNCTTCGDFVCDTPPDPQTFQGNSDCSWNGTSCTGSTTDANGAPYNPAMNLIMAYIAPNCMSQFTNGQGTRMRTFIANNSLLQAATVPNTLTISNTTISSGTHLLYDVLNYVTAQDVTVQSGGSLTLRAGVEVTLLNGFEAQAGSAFDAYIDEVCSNVGQANAARTVTNMPSPAYITTSPALTANIYPNPVNNIVNIFITANTARTIEVKAISISGIVLKTMKYQVNGKGEQRLQWDISGLAKGIYLIQIADGRQLINKKVVKLN